MFIISFVNKMMYENETLQELFETIETDDLNTINENVRFCIFRDPQKYYFAYFKGEYARTLSTTVLIYQFPNYSNITGNKDKFFNNCIKKAYNDLKPLMDFEDE